jgi:hypothetical protein
MTIFGMDADQARRLVRGLDWVCGVLLVSWLLTPAQDWVSNVLFWELLFAVIVRCVIGLRRPQRE